MAVTHTPIFPQTIKNYAARIQNSDSTNKVTFISGGADGTKIEYIEASSDDTAAKNLQLWLSDGTIDHLLTWVNIPASSGNSTTITPINILTQSQIPSLPIDNNGNKYMYLAPGWSIKISVSAAMTATKIMYLKAFGGDF